MAEIAMQIDVAAPRARLLAALDTHDGLTAWWTTGVDRDGDDLLFEFPEAPEPFRLRRERADEDRVAWTSVGEFPPHWVEPRSPGTCSTIRTTRTAPGCSSVTWAGARRPSAPFRWWPAPGRNCWSG